MLYEHDEEAGLFPGHDAMQCAPSPLKRRIPNVFLLASRILFGLLEMDREKKRLQVRVTSCCKSWS